MSSESPAVILYSSDGYELAVVPGSALPTQSRALLVDGSDGTNSRTLLVDTSGRLNIVGAAAAGAAPAGNPLYTGGSVTTAAPAYTTGTVNALSLTTTGLLRVDGTGGVFNNQGVSGTGATTPSFASLAGGAVTTAAPTYTTGQMDPLSLDTAGNLRTLSQISDGTNGPVAVKAPSTAAVATDRALVVAISPNNSITTTSASTSATGAAPPAQATYVGVLATTAANGGLTTGDMYPLNITTGGLLRIDGVYPGQTAYTATTDLGLNGGSVTTANPAYTTGQVSALSLDTSGNLRVLAVGSGTAGTPTGGVLTVQGATGGTPIPVSGTLTIDTSSTGTLTQVAGATTSTTLLAANANRISATFYNNSTAILFLALNATASATAFSIRILPNSYYDLPVTYRGAVSGIWNAVNGNCQVTELT